MKRTSRFGFAGATAALTALRDGSASVAMVVAAFFAGAAVFATRGFGSTGSLLAQSAARQWRNASIGSPSFFIHSTNAFWPKRHRIRRQNAPHGLSFVAGRSPP